jgi:hypothetical protein
MATGLLPARRVAGMAAIAASPEARPSREIGAITSISGSRPPRRSAVGTGSPLGAGKSGSNNGSWRSLLRMGCASMCSTGSSPLAGAGAASGGSLSRASGCRGALRRDIHVL